MLERFSGMASCLAEDNQSQTKQCVSLIFCIETTLLLVSAPDGSVQKYITLDNQTTTLDKQYLSNQWKQIGGCYQCSV